MYMLGTGGRSRALLVGAPALVAFAICLAPLLTRHMSPLAAVLALSGVYWAGCWSLALSGAGAGRLAALYRCRAAGNPLEKLATFSPALVTLFIAFAPSVARMSFPALAAVLGVALVNGLTEEALWRGAFVSVFPGSFQLAFVYPLVLFSSWHFALFLVSGVNWGGVYALVGGSAVFGALWGWVVWRTRSLRLVSVAHVLTNVFAFTQLALHNWV